jgi:hypothetical protein
MHTWSSTPITTNWCSREGSRWHLCSTPLSAPRISCRSTIFSYCSVLRSYMRLLFLQLLCFLWIPIEEKINLYKGEPLQRVIT